MEIKIIKKDKQYIAYDFNDISFGKYEYIWTIKGYGETEGEAIKSFEQARKDLVNYIKK